MSAVWAEETPPLRDFAELLALHDALQPGMARAQVNALLGPADYSPTQGLYYYASTQQLSLGERMPRLTFTLVLDYRDAQHELTGALQKFWIAPIGE